MSDRGRDVSPELTEVRTVLSRAETALNTLDYIRRQQAKDGEAGFYGTPDADFDRMYGALNEVVAWLDEWRRTGRPKK